MKTAKVATTIFELPELPYGYNAFPETIDPMTMEIHYTKHHKGYTDKLNIALKEANITGKTIEEILDMDNLPTAIRNNGGGYFNHNLYWESLIPGGTMSAAFKAKVIEDFGSEEAFKIELADAGAKRFGSGWAWVIQKNDKKLQIISTPNQDNTLMKNAEMKGTPILGIDVWEHAYYLKYQNKRADYLQKIFNIINWEKWKTECADGSGFSIFLWKLKNQPLDHYKSEELESKTEILLDLGYKLHIYSPKYDYI